jgi:hypothetical protein
MPIKFTNNATTTLASSITASATSIPLAVGTGALFPPVTTASGNFFYATLVDSSNNIEIVKVTNRATDTVTVVRGQDGTTAKAYIGGDKFELRPTAAGLEDLGSGMNITDLPAGTTMGGSAITTPTATQTLTNKTLTSPTINGGSIDSPNLTGTPTAPTASVGTNNTQIASTAFVAAAVSALIPSGTKMLFQQTAAPTGWTKDTVHDNKALRVVTGSAGSGGSLAFTTAFASRGTGGTVGDTTLAASQIPGHTHTYQAFSGPGKGSSTGTRPIGSGSIATVSFTGNTSAGTGGGGSHGHTFSGSALDMSVQYVDVIIATKN